MPLYAHVILPLAVSQDYTYEIPLHLADSALVGMRAEVQFGAKRIYAGIIKKIFEAETPAFPTKPILNLLDEEPIVSNLQLQMWQWMSAYYLCSEGDIMTAALPSAYRLSSETKLSLNPSFNRDFSLLDDREYLIAEALTTNEEITIDQARDIIDARNAMVVIKSLLEKGVICVHEELVERYKPRTATFVGVPEKWKEKQTLENLFKQLEKAPKQLTLFMTYMHYSILGKRNFIEKKMLIEKAQVSETVYKALAEKGIFEEEERVVSRLEGPTGNDLTQNALPDNNNKENNNNSSSLNELQEKVFADIKAQFEHKQVVLLYGVTSSGKTQIYIEFIRQIIADGKQALYLLPEIALTTQMVSRLKKVFGHQIGVYHSRFNDQERVEIWQKVLTGDYKVVIGARSALFLPFQTLGVIIIDEEHDPSFKQHEPAPRYNARDCAIYLAALHQAKTLLGSATPSVESYYNATKGQKYGFAALRERFGGVEPPKIEVVNLRKAAKINQMHSHFSEDLLREIKVAVQQGEQVIIFQNRRGYAPYLQCSQCEWIPQCISCDVSLTYHKYANELRCHYCGYRRKLIAQCDSCGSTNLQIQGFGTEKVEDELKIYFPDLKIGRLDLDVARTKTGFERVIQEFDEHKIHILVGTQMITKGLDFENVSLVGILSADHLLNFPDFRASERAFDLMMQVSGRAGRRQKQGRVLVQTMNPRYKVLDFLLNNDYHAFFVEEMYERMLHNYPPFCRLVTLTLKHPKQEIANNAAFELGSMLKKELQDKVLGPTVPLVAWVRNYHLRQILLKLDKSPTVLSRQKNFLKATVEKLQSAADFKSIVIQIDVDPY